jgi:hypothetical protein
MKFVSRYMNLYTIIFIIYFPNLARSSSITLSSSFLNSGAG